MLLRLLQPSSAPKPTVIAQKKLITKDDFDRIGRGSVLLFRGVYYSFAGINRADDCVTCDFTLVPGPVVIAVDGFVEAVNS